MSGDWIKMRKALHTHPKTVRIASALKADRLRVVGALHAVWSLFDEHSEDGSLDGYTPDMLDLMIGWPGFTVALSDVEWIEIVDENLILPRFDDHNGSSAKRRAQEADRKRDARKASADDADKNRTREEKSREDKDQKPSSSAAQKTGAGLDDRAKKEQRLAEITEDAIAAFNQILGKPKGLLPAVHATVGKEKRRKQVGRILKVVRDICSVLYKDPHITKTFWIDYFTECDLDPFKSGRQPSGKGHENWTPSFEYLTREDVVIAAFDKAQSMDEAA